MYTLYVFHPNLTFFCKRKNAQKAPLTGSGVFCAFNLYGDGLKRTDLAYACVASLRLWRMGCQSFRENIFGKCGGFLAVVYHIFLMRETVFDDRGPPGGLLEAAVLCMCEKTGRNFQ